MKNITLNTGAEMPMLGLGVYKIDDTSSIHTAFEAGYRSIDTASAYDNEELVGAAIRESGLPRDELFITTKLSNPGQREGRAGVELDDSLNRLGLDYVDLYLMHWPVPETYADSWRAMEKLFKKGRAKAIGVSNFQSRHITEIKKQWTVVPAINQVELHPRLTQKPLLWISKMETIALQSWSPLGGGRDFAFKEQLFAHETIESLAKKYGKTPAQIILRWNIDLGIVTIPKSATPERIRENIDIFDFSLTQAEVTAIDMLNQNHRTGPDPDTFHNDF
ncbi:MAG: aldo/keto reductase [Defluviitaleaceae bacterium]|nr:aldo/keto reductase [Defluviitaleaceae bacterium]